MAHEQWNAAKFDGLEQMFSVLIMGEASREGKSVKGGLQSKEALAWQRRQKTIVFH